MPDASTPIDHLFNDIAGIACFLVAVFIAWRVQLSIDGDDSARPWKRTQD